MILYLPKLIRKGYSGFAFWPFIVMRSKEVCDECNLRHERIHLAQQKELLVLPFYFLYFLEYVLRRLRSSSWSEAYMNISFEREAYANDMKEGYLAERSFWTWTCYLRA